MSGGTKAKMSELGAKYQQLQNELEEFIVARQKLETQLQENKIVNEEFDQLEEDTPVYKLTGNVLYQLNKVRHVPTWTKD